MVARLVLSIGWTSDSSQDFFTKLFPNHLKQLPHKDFCRMKKTASQHKVWKSTQDGVDSWKQMRLIGTSLFGTIIFQFKSVYTSTLIWNTFFKLIVHFCTSYMERTLRVSKYTFNQDQIDKFPLTQKCFVNLPLCKKYYFIKKTRCFINYFPTVSLWIFFTWFSAEVRFGEISIGRVFIRIKVRSAKVWFDENSVRRKINRQKFPW